MSSLKTVSLRALPFGRENKRNQAVELDPARQTDGHLKRQMGKFLLPATDRTQSSIKMKEQGKNAPKSLNYVAKKKEAERIDQENQKIMRRIVNQ